MYDISVSFYLDVPFCASADHDKWKVGPTVGLRADCENALAVLYIKLAEALKTLRLRSFVRAAHPG
jgi:hypothetical protein